MITDSLFPGLQLPAEVSHSQATVELFAPHSAVLPPHRRTEETSAPVSLETRGVTSHRPQAELFNRQLLFKLSVAAKLKECGSWDLAKPLEGCHTSIAFAECTNCKKVRRFWNRCDRFYCPACQPRLARERVESLQWWTNQVDQAKHVVLTARNTATLTEQYVRWFKSQFGKLRRRKLCRNWKGGLYALEVTKEEKGWHLHIHILVDARWIDQRLLSIEWGKLVGQDYAIVWVRDARAKSYLKEVLKYDVEGSTLSTWSGADITHFVNAFSNSRTFGVFGTLYGKRTQWREWIKSIAKTKGACECGCTQFDIYDESSWRIHQRRLHIIYGGRPPPRSGLVVAES